MYEHQSLLYKAGFVFRSQFTSESQDGISLGMPTSHFSVIDYYDYACK
jgi:hypothetical protein